MFERTDELGNVYNALSTDRITTEATAWVGQFDTILLVVIGIGIGFSVVRFVKGLFS